MKVPQNKILLFLLISLFLSLAVVLHKWLTPSPPIVEMNYARVSISVAAKKQAEQYSSVLYSQAISHYDSAMILWGKENRRFIYLRNYERVFFLANISAEKANMAVNNSVKATSLHISKITNLMDSLNHLVSEIDILFASYPLDIEVRRSISKGKYLLEEAEVAFASGQSLEADNKLQESEDLLKESFKYAKDTLNGYFKSFPVWRKWVDNTIQNSKINKDYSIIVDKFSRSCFIYFKGVLQYQFDMELGKNWVGPKRVSGDKATPEGMYKITKKIDNGKTKYYKALLLDYPNSKDMMKFNADMSKGILSPGSNMGGLIEIHGNGGKGIDWTDGCIALSDEEMDIVFKIASIGTPVTIVGSTVDLHKIIEER